MIPIRDTVPTQRTPVVTWSLIAANVAVFGYELWLPPEALDQLFHSLGLVPWQYSTGTIALADSLKPFFGSQFLHGGLFHLIANMWTLWIFGDNVEDRMGSFRFLAFYLSCGLIAGAVHLLTNLHSPLPTVGASGAIAGVLGAYFILFPLARVVTLIPVFFWPVFVELPAFVFLGFWFVTQLMSGGMTQVDGGAGGIAWWAHVGGFGAGAVLWRSFLAPSERQQRKKKYKY